MSTVPLTEEQLARIEENRAKALLRLQASKEREIRVNSNAESVAEPSVPQGQTVMSFDNSINGLENKACQQLRPDGSPCTSLTVNKLLLDVFGQYVCSACREHNNEFDLLTKGDCQSLYLIPVDELKWMKFHEKINPYVTVWRPMKLFLRKDAIEAAKKRFGSLEAMESERKKRQEINFRRNLEKTKNVLEEATQDFKAQLSTGVTLTSTKVTGNGNEKPNVICESKKRQRSQGASTKSTKRNVEFYSNLAKSLLETDQSGIQNSES